MKKKRKTRKERKRKEKWSDFCNLDLSNACVQAARAFYEDNGYLQFCQLCKNVDCVVTSSVFRMVLVAVHSFLEVIIQPFHLIFFLDPQFNLDLVVWFGYRD